LSRVDGLVAVIPGGTYGIGAATVADLQTCGADLASVVGSMTGTHPPAPPT